MKNYIEEISVSLYNQLGEINKLSITENHRLMISSVSDTKKFILFNFRKYDLGYSIGLMLTFPDLWIKFTIDDWSSLIASNFPREVIIDGDYRLMNNDGKFADLIFLHRYLKVNSIEMLINNSEILKTDIINCLLFCKIYSYKFFISKEELNEDLEGFYEITLKQLEVYSTNLMNDGVSPGFNNADDLIDYVDRMLGKLYLK